VHARRVKLYYKRSHTLRGTKFTMEHKQT